MIFEGASDMLQANIWSLKPPVLIIVPCLNKNVSSLRNIHNQCKTLSHYLWNLCLKSFYFFFGSPLSVSLYSFCRPSEKRIENMQKWRNSWGARFETCAERWEQPKETWKTWGMCRRKGCRIRSLILSLSLDSDGVECLLFDLVGNIKGSWAMHIFHLTDWLSDRTITLSHTNQFWIKSNASCFY